MNIPGFTAEASLVSGKVVQPADLFDQGYFCFIGCLYRCIDRRNCNGDGQCTYECGLRCQAKCYP
ncbi:MAG: hypothetical protein WAO55_03335 [Candidatus Manganitrophaceae bacterium]|jgi:hypothetical protein